MEDAAIRAKPPPIQQHQAKAEKSQRRGSIQAHATRLLHQWGCDIAGEGRRAQQRVDVQITMEQSLHRGEQPDERGERAKECRDVANGTTDAEAQRELRDLALDLDREASNIDAEEAPRLNDPQTG